MTLHQSFSEDTESAVAMVAAPERLSVIKQASCAAAIWQREPMKAFQDWVDELTPHELPKARILLRPGDVRQAMTDLVDSYSLATCDERTMLVDDVAALAHIFSNIVDAPFVRLRLDVIDTNACRSFHVDMMTARLICTYRGTGTQYGVSKLGNDPERIFTTKTGNPIVLRGHLWPAVGAPKLLHRSPPIEGTGETRLLLVLDPVKDLEEARKEDVLH